VPKLLRSKLALGVAIVVLLAGGGAIYVATRGEPAPKLRAGSFEISPGSLTFDATMQTPAADGTLRRTLSLHNAGARPSSYTLATDASWLIVGSKAAATVPAGATELVDLLADARSTHVTEHRSLKVSSEGDTVSIPATLIPGAGLVPSGPARFVPIPGMLDLGMSSIAARFEIENIGADAAEWHAAGSASWIDVRPALGELAGGGRATLDVTVDRSLLEEGTHDGSVQITYGPQGKLVVPLHVTVGPQPILSLPSGTVDFGRARKGRKTLSFIVANAGHEPLTYQVSNDRFYVFLDETASGTVQPGKTASVNVTFDHNTSLYGVRDFPLGVTSNGGSGSVRVYGITDTVGPKATNENMKFIHTHGNGQLYRHARADLKDEFGKTISARVQYRTCTGTPPAPPACSPWTLSEMRRYRGVTWEADIGPLPACSSATGVFLNWRIQVEDDLVNHRFNPGSAGYYSWIHCQAPG